MEEWQRQLIETGVAILLLILFRYFANQYIDRSTLQSTRLKRRWNVQIRNLTFIIFIFALFIIWGTELRSLAISLMAIVVGIVLATKELILCLTGSFLKASASSFTIGDRIRVNDTRGVVTDQTLLTTTLLEVGPGMDSHQITGKTIIVPNSLFLSQMVFNENTNEYTLHSFSMTLKVDENLMLFKKELLNELSKNSLKEELSKAVKTINKALEGNKIDEQTCKPRVVLQMVDDSTAKLIFRTFVKLDDIGRLEQHMFEKYIELKLKFDKKTDQKQAELSKSESN